MRCPFCGNIDTQVKDSRSIEENNAIRRRRYCPSCLARFTTMERTQLLHLMVKKKNQELEPFDRDRLEKSMMIALHKRPVDKDHIERIINSIVRQLEARGESEIETSLIGELVMEALLEIDLVAYIRFASVYHNFKVIKDFEKFVKSLNESSKEITNQD